MRRALFSSAVLFIKSIHWDISIHALIMFTFLSHTYNVHITLFWVDCTDIGEINNNSVLVRRDLGS